MLAELTFDAEAHVYRVGGVRWPSVTQVLDPLNELDGVPRHLIEAAGRFGNHVHQACHLWDLGQLDEEALDPELEPYLRGWKKFLKDTGAEVIESERQVIHRRLKYCGTLDKTIKLAAKHHLVDIKSGALVPRTVGPQTAAYREAYLHDELSLSPVRYCVHLRPDGDYRRHTLKDPADLNIFVSALNIHYWRNPS